jgi:hypothetical protein
MRGAEKLTQGRRVRFGVDKASHSGGFRSYRPRQSSPQTWNSLTVAPNSDIHFNENGLSEAAPTF